MIASSYSELNERISALVGTDMLKLNGEVQKASVKYGKQEAYVEMLEHGRKSLLSFLHEDWRVKLPNATEKQLENKSRSDPQYKEYLRLLKKEKDKLVEFKSEYFGLRNHQETVHAQLGFAKSEMYLEKG